MKKDENSGYAILIPADDADDAKIVTVSRDHLLDDLQRLVGGYTEPLPLGRRAMMVVNVANVEGKESRMSGLPENCMASAVASRDSFFGANGIIGDAVILKATAFDMVPYDNYSYVALYVLPKYRKREAVND